MDHSAHNHHAAEPPSEMQKWLKRIAIGTALAAGAVIIAPYVLPVVGIGTAEVTEEAMLALHATGAGTGLAGALNGVIAGIPGIGAALAEGGVVTTAATGIIGIGGMLLGRYLEKRDDGTHRINWGKVIKTGALITSALIALPSVLTGISTGIVFLCAAISGASLASSAVALMGKTLGSIGTATMATGGVTGAALTLPHLLTCGSSILPVCIAWAMGDKSPAAKANEASVTASVEVQEPTQAGKPANGVLRLSHKNGTPLTAEELAVVHTEKIHLFVVDETLKDYRHIHPVATGQPGAYAFSFTPGTNNRYKAWADFTLLSNNQNHRIPSDIASKSNRAAKPSVRINSSGEAMGMQFNFSTSEPLEKGKPVIAEVMVTDPHGNPVSNLEPVMGAFAHLVGFNSDGQSIIHTHPMGAEPQTLGDRGGPRLRFHIEPDCSGPTQFYLQVRKNGEDIFVPFGQHIKPPEAERHRQAALQPGCGHAVSV